MIPYSKPILSDLHTLSQTKLVKNRSSVGNHTLQSGTYPYILYMGVPPLRCGAEGGGGEQIPVFGLNSLYIFCLSEVQYIDPDYSDFKWRLLYVIGENFTQIVELSLQRFVRGQGAK